MKHRLDTLHAPGQLSIPRSTSYSVTTKTEHYIGNYSLNPLMSTLKPESNEPLYNSTVIGTLAVNGCAVTFGTARGAWAGGGSAQSLPHCSKCNSPPINHQRTNFILFDEALQRVNQRRFYRKILGLVPTCVHQYGMSSHYCIFFYFLNPSGIYHRGSLIIIIIIIIIVDK